MAKVALTNIVWADQAFSPGPPTSSYTGLYAKNQTMIPLGGVVPDKIPAEVQDEWLSQGLVEEV
jgi:hypothetical protein